MKRSIRKWEKNWEQRWEQVPADELNKINNILITIKTKLC